MSGIWEEHFHLWISYRVMSEPSSICWFSQKPTHNTVGVAIKVFRIQQLLIVDLQSLIKRYIEMVKIYSDCTVLENYYEMAIFLTNSLLGWFYLLFLPSNLEGNVIEKIQENSFIKLQSLKTLILKRNKLRVLKTGTFEGLRSLTEL